MMGAWPAQGGGQGVLQGCLLVVGVDEGQGVGVPFEVAADALVESAGDAAGEVEAEAVG